MDGKFPPNFYVIQDRRTDLFMVCGPDTKEVNLQGQLIVLNLYGCAPEILDAETEMGYMESIYGKFPH